MDVFFRKSTLFYPKLSSGEKPNLVANFWNHCTVVLLFSPICPDITGSTMPSIETTQPRGEILQNGHIDQVPGFKFYTRRNFNQRNQDQIVDH